MAPGAVDWLLEQARPATKETDLGSETTAPAAAAAANGELDGTTRERAAERGRVAVLEADGVRLPYRVFPAARAGHRGNVVYLHGIQSHGAWYVDTAAELARRGYSVYLPDRRGSGASGAPRGHFERPQQLVDDAARFVALSKSEAPGVPTFLVGGCWGARPALSYALQADGAVDGLVLVCPALKARVDLSPLEKVKVFAGRALAPEAPVPVPLEPEMFTGNPERLEYIRRDPLSLREVTARFFFETALWDRRLRRQDRLDVPVLLLQAADDPIVDDEWVRGWFQRLDAPDKRLVVYPGSGHILDFEPDPQRYLDDLASWLDGATRRPHTMARGATFVARIDSFAADLPFRFSFGHALAERSKSTNVYARLTLSDGTTGYGEGVPRDYVTGETAETAVEALTERQAPALVGRELRTPDDVVEALAEIPSTRPDGRLDHAARCALELALLDAAGRRFRRSVQDWLGGGRVPFVRYDAVIPFSSPRKLKALALAVRVLGIRQVKIKVGDDLEHDLKSLELLRSVLGDDVDIRVDANCAWTVDEALAAIERMRAFRLSAVEQPVAGDDLDGLAAVTAATPELIIADESLRTIEEAERLAAARACDAFNIRVSKCGGLLPSFRIGRIAADAGLACIVGAQVGESGLLSAAGRHLAAAIAPRYVEGSGGSLLLKQDLTVENVLPGRRGLARPHEGFGLGVRVDEAVFRRYGRPVGAVEANG